MAGSHRLILTWADVERRVDDVAFGVGPWVADVHGIPRGGCVPAAMIAARLGVPLTATVGPRTLVVDDLVDSGRTAAAFDPHRFVALYAKRWSPQSYSRWARDVGEAWVVFPWEVAEPEGVDGALRVLQAAGVDTSDPAAVAAAELLGAQVAAACRDWGPNLSSAALAGGWGRLLPII